MPKRPMTTEDLWALPRVGRPVLSPDGETLVVPVRTHSLETNDGTTQLWSVPSGSTRAGSGGRGDAARALTSPDMTTGRPDFDPSGKRLAFVRKPVTTANGRRVPEHADVAQVHILPLSGGDAECVTDLPNGAIDPLWFPDGERIAFISEVYVDAATPEAASARKSEIAEDPVSALVTESRVYRMWDKWVTHGKVPHIFVLDLRSRELMDLTPKQSGWMSFMEISDAFVISPDGREIAFSASSSSPPHSPLLWGSYTVAVPAKIRAGARVTAPRRLTPKSVPRAMRPVYSADGRTIVFGIQRDHEFYADRVRLVAHDRRTRKQTVLTEAWDRSPSAWAFADDGLLYFTAETEGRTAIYALDVARARKDPEGHPPRELVRGGTFGAPSIAAGRIYATRTSIDAPPEVYAFDANGKKPRRVTAFTEAVMSSIAPSLHDEFLFDGHGGDPVQMFVVYPPGVKRPAEGKKPTRKLPLVHLVHGGPHGMFGDSWHWRWNAWRFAAEGYAVAMVNFHGSTSWGQAFAASILGSWGDQPYVDVMRATDELVDRGIADEKRMAVAGGSYGGYLVSWIASQTDRFRCIVNHAGVCDLQAQFASDATQGRPRSFGGELWKNIEGLDRYNPIRHASGFSSPMLVLHGEKDYRVPYVEGLEIYNVYKAMKLPARLVVYPDENHWILKPQNSIHWYGEVIAWLARWMGSSSAARARASGR